MSTLEIQKFLRVNPLLALEGEPWHLSIKRHPKYNNLVQFTYNQIDSVKDDPIVREARGLILDEAKDWNVVAFPFKRFFNYGEGAADKIDWATAKVQEKIDGSLFIMYYYDGTWHVATKGSPDAGGQVGEYRNVRGQEFTFRDLFWNSCEYWLKGLSKSGQFNPSYTYMWELTSPYNRVVCDYTVLKDEMEVVNEDGVHSFVEGPWDATGYGGDGSRITLIGVRDNLTSVERRVDDFRNDVHYVVRDFPIGSIEQVLEAAKILDPLKQEGFVVVDAKFNRIKVKSPAYVAIHHLRDGSPSRRIIELIKSNEGPEVMAYKLLDEFPAEKKLFEDFQEKIDRYSLQTELAYANIKNIAVQKEFALEALKTPYHAALFAMRKGQVRSAREFYLKMPTDKLLDLVEKV